jgi:serine/arginine repetitive matrix protein 2
MVSTRSVYSYAGHEYIYMWSPFSLVVSSVYLSSRHIVIIIDRLSVGIGLSTVRGSGTSGYVQTNKFHIRGRNPLRPEDSREDVKHAVVHRKPNAAILEHNEKREIEVKVEALREKLEEEGLEEEEIEERLNTYRTELQSKRVQQAGANRQEPSAKDKLGMDTHQLAFRKAQQMEKLKNAFGYKKDIIEGEAFDQELQEQRRQQRHEEREARRIEYEQRKATFERHRDDERVDGKKPHGVEDLGEYRERRNLPGKEKGLPAASPNDKNTYFPERRRSPRERDDSDKNGYDTRRRRSRERRHRTPSPSPEDDEEEGEFRQRWRAGYRSRSQSRSRSRSRSRRRSRSRSRSRGRPYLSRSRSRSWDRGRSKYRSSPSTESTSYDSGSRSPPRSRRRL